MFFLGPLLAVGDLSSSFINPSTVNISWSPPFTLPGTSITGYNISVTSNRTTANYFTSDSYYVLEWSNDFSCNDTSVAISGYNGLDGELQSINVWQSSGKPSTGFFFSISVSQIQIQTCVYEYVNIAIVPPSDVPLPVSVIIDGDLQLTVVIDVSIHSNFTKVCCAKCLHLCIVSCIDHI